MGDVTALFSAPRSAPRRLVRAAFIGVIAIAPVFAAIAARTDAPPTLLAGCDDTIDTTDSFSMNCVPTVIPDMSDQLTEAEVAMPGWNATPGGPGGGGRR